MTGPDAEALPNRLLARLMGGDPLPGAVRRRFEDAFGADLGGVRVHTDAEAASLAGDLGARAFTTGQHVFFASASWSPGTAEGDGVIAHELAHTLQPELRDPPSAAAVTVTDPAGPLEDEAHRLAGRALTGQLAAPARDARPDATLGRRARMGGGTAIGRLTVGRQPQGPMSTPPLTIPPQLVLAPPKPATEPVSGIPEAYQGLVTPSLSDADTRKLELATSSTGVVQLIRGRDEVRRRLRNPYPGTGAGSRDEAGPRAENERLLAEEKSLSARITARLGELSVANEAQLLQLVEVWFPNRFLAEAKVVALDMLKHNEAEAKSELARYSAQVCSPDLDGLFAADRVLAQLSPNTLILDIQSAEATLAKYAPPAGVLTLEELAKRVPENEQSVMVAIANLDRNRALLEQLRPVYQAARYTYGRTYPFLLSSEYAPGSLSSAPEEDLGRMVAGPITSILENIARVREAISENDLKVWNMPMALAITVERLSVRDPVLVAAIDAKIAQMKSDESFLSLVKAALAIVTTIAAGMLLTPLAAAGVAAAWGTASLHSSVTDYLNETAANNVALDSAVADISLNEPSLTWVILDAAFLALDLGVVARALRPAARAVAAGADVVSIAALRRAAAREFGDETAERLATRVAARFGVAEAALGLGEEQLTAARAILAGLDLSDEAIARILAKGTHVHHLKGQLLEEVMNREVVRRLAAGPSPLLGITDTAGLEFIEGHRIADLARAQLTDGMILRRLDDGSVEIVTVFEAKSGRSAAQGLRSSSSGIGDPEEFAQFVIEQNKEAVLRVLRRADLQADVEIVLKGSEKISAEAITAIAEDKGLRRTVVQAEMGGQVRKDVERLAPITSSDLDDLGRADEQLQRIRIDGVPTYVRISPQRTRFVGVVPEGLDMTAIRGYLRGQRFNFETLALGGTAADLTRLAERLAAIRTAASTTASSSGATAAGASAGGASLTP